MFLHVKSQMDQDSAALEAFILFFKFILGVQPHG